MITFNNIVSKFQAFCDDHKFIRTFSYGSPADVDLDKFDQYPLLHLVYTGGDYNTERAKTYNLECYILSVPPSEADKTTYQKESISDAEQVAEDILADIQNGGNIFSFGYHYDVTGASVTPLEEEKSNALAGCLLDLSISVPYSYDSCNAPLEGVEPEGSTTPSYKARGLLRVRELDGSPDVLSVATMNVPNGSLTDDGDGEITLTFGGDSETAEKINFPVRNDEGARIIAGTPLYSRGEIGGSERILVGIADASDPDKMPAIGIAETDLLITGDDKDGDAIMVGTYNTNLSGFTGLEENDVLYVANGGGLTKDKPTYSNLIQNVGVVLKTNGTICQGLKVSCIGRTNDVPNMEKGHVFLGGGALGPTVESDWGFSATAPAENETWVYNDSVDLWEPGHPISDGQVSTFQTLSTYSVNYSAAGAYSLSFGSILGGTTTFSQSLRAGFSAGWDIGVREIKALPVAITSTVQVSISIEITAPTGCLALLNMVNTTGFFTAPSYTGDTIVGDGTKQTYTITSTVGQINFWQEENTAQVQLNIATLPSGTITVEPESFTLTITHA